MNIKTEFNIEKGFIEIWEKHHRNNSVPFIRIVINNESSQMSGKDLEHLAVNILKAIGSKKLK